MTNPICHKTTVTEFFVVCACHNLRRWSVLYDASLPHLGEKDIMEKMAIINTFGPILTLYQTSPGFYVSAVKTLWEKEKLLVTSNFSFSRSVFYPFGELSAIFIKLEIVVCKLFQFGRV